MKQHVKDRNWKRTTGKYRALYIGVERGGVVQLPSGAGYQVRPDGWRRIKVG